MSIARTTLQGGMNEVIPPEHLPEDQASLIQNMRIDQSGQWRAVRVPREAQQGITQLSEWTWSWKPVHLPADCIEDTIYISFSNLGNLSVVYKKSSGYHTAGIRGRFNVSKLRVASDAQQFVMVDGRDGNGAYRLTIDADGAIHLRKFGTQRPLSKPVVHQIDNERFKDGEGTGMPVGSILLYCYCIVNEYGERSNPSPVVVCDTASWYAKGELLESSYSYSDVNKGSIVRVSVECAIPVPDEAKRVELYRTSSQYCESIAPLDTMKLVAAKDTDGASSINITDTNFASPTQIDYENDSAPAGDDIALDSGTMFIANAVNDDNFPGDVSNVWAITIENKNPLNYINRWITLDIRSKESAVSGLQKLVDLEGYNLFDKCIFFDSDRVSPLTAYGINNTSETFKECTDIVSGDTIKYWMLLHIQIPYIPANAEKTIYLVEGEWGRAYPDHPPLPIALDTANQNEMTELYDLRIDNPVRDENCIISTGKTNDSVVSTDSWQEEGGNKANALFSRADTGSIPTTIEDPIRYRDDQFTGDGVIISLSNVIYLDGANHGNATISYERISGLIARNDGYIYGFGFNSQPTNGYLKIFETNFKSSSSGRRSLQGFFSHQNISNGVKFRASIYEESTIKSSTEVVLPIQTTDVVSFYFFVSWERQRNQGGSNNTQTALNVCILAFCNDKEYWGRTQADNLPSLERRESPKLILYPSRVISLGNWYMNNGEYVENAYEAFEFSRFGTHFPVEAIGYRGTYTEISGSKYIVNQNVTFEHLSMVNEKRPGRIRWSLGGSVPSLYERNIQDEVTGIIPVRSFQPMDEHNTILVFTDRRVIRMPLLGDNKEASAVYTEIEGIGLQDRKALAQVDGGIIWSERSGIYYLSGRGLEKISLGRVEPGTYRVIFNSRDREVLFVNAQGTARVYSLEWNNWSIRNYGIEARGFIEYNGLWCLIGSNGIYELSPEDDDSTLIPKILTRKMALGRGGKIRRITLHSAAGTVRAYIYNHRLPGGYTSSPTYNVSGDDPKAIPGLSGDYVQFEIATDRIKSIEIEDNSNG